MQINDILNLVGLSLNFIGSILLGGKSDDLDHLNSVGLDQRKRLIINTLPGQFKTEKGGQGHRIFQTNKITKYS